MNRAQCFSPRTTVSGATEARSADIAGLGRWIRSWITGEGAIHGFHNHTVWGANPYRIGDFTAGHSTFSSPQILALLRLLALRDDPRGRDLLERMIRFQVGSSQQDGQFEHVGFQVGELASYGLIHNAVPCVVLLLACRDGEGILGASLVDACRERAEGNLRAMDAIYDNTARLDACNQEYARTWARLLFAEITGDSSSLERGLGELERLVEAFHVRNVPSDGCVGAFRGAGKEQRVLEPAEYYGLMIMALLSGYRLSGRESFLDEAVGLALHVVRSAWKDANGRTRLHRLWMWRKDSFIRIREPMCISGAGLTALGLDALNRLRPIGEISEFLEELDRSYSFYQHPAGFFLPASGWHSELDIAPATAWHSQDLLYLARRRSVLEEGFWDTFFGDAPPAILLGDQCFYAEKDGYWGIYPYETHGGCYLSGKKEEDVFFRVLPGWMDRAEPVPADRIAGEIPDLWRTDESFDLYLPERSEWEVASWEEREIRFR